jgi:hypothetical protein
MVPAASMPEAAVASAPGTSNVTKVGLAPVTAVGGDCCAGAATAKGRESPMATSLRNRHRAELGLFSRFVRDGVVFFIFILRVRRT